MAKQYRITRMESDDLDAVHALECEIYPNPWPITIFRDCLRVGYLCQVMRTIPDDAIVGYAIMSVAANESHIFNVAMMPAYQGRGLGKKFVHELTRNAHRLGAEKMILEVRVSNLPAIAIYTKLGFEQIGVRAGYYPGEPREDALIYALDLTKNE